MALADCECEYAAREREKIAAQVQKFTLTSRAEEQAAYTAVLKDYVAHHGSKSVLKAAQRSEWVAWVAAATACAAAIAVLIALVERLRQKPGRRKTELRGKSRRNRT